MNLVQQIKDQITGVGIKRLSSLIGASEGATQTAVNGAVPALLSGLSNLASSGSSGAEKVVSALDDFDGQAQNFGSMLSGEAGSLLEKGASALSSLFGGGTISGLTNVLTKFSGLGGTAVKNLLGYLTPATLAAIAQRFVGKQVSAQGLTSLFAEQKANIANSMPAGFSLSDVPGLQPAAQALGSAAKTVGTAARDAAGQVQQAGQSATKWLVPVACLALLVLVGWLLYKALAPSVPDVAKLSTDLTGSFNTMSDTLNGIKDTASAEAALPKLKELGNKVEGIKALADKLPKEGKEKIHALIKSNLSKLQEAGNAAIALVPAEAGKLKPGIENCLTQVASVGGLAAPAISLPAPTLGKLDSDLSSYFKSMTATLGGIKDATSATAAMPEFSKFSTALDSMKSMMEKLPTESKAKVTELIQSKLGNLDNRFAELLWTPGLSEKFKPAIEGLMDKTAALGGLKSSSMPQLSGELAGAFSLLNKELGTIKDAATADAVLPKLADINKKLDSAKAALQDLPAESKAKLQALIEPALDKLKEVASKVTAMPSVQDTELRPAVDAIISKLTALK